MPDVVIVYTTWPDAGKAEAAGAEAVAERLAACVNIFAPIRSIYRWQGAVESAAEVPMTLKTTDAAAPALVAFLSERHPYETPCILAWPTAPGLSHAGYLDWVQDEVVAPAISGAADEPVSPGEA